MQIKKNEIFQKTKKFTTNKIFSLKFEVQMKMSREAQMYHL